MEDWSDIPSKADFLSIQKVSFERRWYTGLRSSSTLQSPLRMLANHNSHMQCPCYSCSFNFEPLGTHEWVYRTSVNRMPPASFVLMNPSTSLDPEVMVTQGQWCMTTTSESRLPAIISICSKSKPTIDEPYPWIGFPPLRYRVETISAALQTRFPSRRADSSDSKKLSLYRM